MILENAYLTTKINILLQIRAELQRGATLSLFLYGQSDDYESGWRKEIDNVFTEYILCVRL